MRQWRLRNIERRSNRKRVTFASESSNSEIAVEAHSRRSIPSSSRLGIRDTLKASMRFGIAQFKRDSDHKIPTVPRLVEQFLNLTKNDKRNWLTSSQFNDSDSSEHSASSVSECSPIRSRS